MSLAGLYSGRVGISRGELVMVREAFVGGDVRAENLARLDLDGLWEVHGAGH